MYLIQEIEGGVQAFLSDRKLLRTSVLTVRNILLIRSVQTLCKSVRRIDIPCPAEKEEVNVLSKFSLKALDKGRPKASNSFV